MPKNTVCLVAILKNEEPFLDEWLVYHKLIGIEHFFIYDDEGTGNLSVFLKPHCDDVTIIDWKKETHNRPGVGNQVAAYTHALNHFLKEYEWVIFLDADEFIVLREHSSIKQFLSGFPGMNAVSLNWHVFGHNGYYDNPKGLITTSLTRRMYEPAVEVKSFTRTEFIAKISYPHYCDLRSGMWSDANGTAYAENLYTGKTGVAHINHYQCRSFLNWMKRASRGDVNFTEQNLPGKQQWRLNEELLFKTFITSVARDKNEYVDKFMLKYQYDIQKGIEKLSRKKNDFILGPGESMLIDKSHYALDKIAKILEPLIDSIEDIGLYNGSSGVALFFFSYGNFIANEHFLRIGEGIIDTIADKIDQDVEINYADGVAGFGALVEYLVEKKFIRCDTDSVLEDIDDLINYQLIAKGVKAIDMDHGLTGLGKYYLYRLNNCVNDDHGHRKIRNSEIINEIVELLETSFNNYDDLRSVIQFLADAYPYCTDKTKARDYLRYAIDKMETMISEDRHFGIDPGKFSCLAMSLEMSGLYKKMKEDHYQNMAVYFLNQDRIVRQKNDDTELSLKEGLPFLWFVNANLFVEHQDMIYREAALACLKKTVEAAMSGSGYFSGSPSSKKAIGLINGIAGIGMTILSAIDPSPPDWLKLIGVHVRD